MDFNIIYNEFQPYVFSFFNYKINSREDAEELATDVMLKLHKHMENYDENKSSMKTWITKIASNTLIDYFRKKKNATMSIENQFDDALSLKEKLVTKECNPADSYLEKEKRNAIYEAINNVKNDELKLIALLFFIQDRSYKEISMMTKTPIGSVKGKIFRVRGLLQNKLKKVRV